MQPTEMEARQLYEDLQPGDRVEVIHEVKVGLERWFPSTVGTVERKVRRLHGEHFRRSGDDRVWTDRLVLRLASGELTTVSIDEFTVLKRV